MKVTISFADHADKLLCVPTDFQAIRVEVLSPVSVETSYFN